MAKKRDQGWHLDPHEVGASRDWLRTGRRRGGATRTSRAATKQVGHLVLTHYPTGLKVEGRTSEGHFTRQQMTQEMDGLRERLWRELEELVARELRIPGR